MEFPPLPNVSSLTHFPLPESNWLEFKASPSHCVMNKIPATICAFLNTIGGYIIIGVEDASLAILGVSVSEYDHTALFVDNTIYRGGAVRTMNGGLLPLGAVKCTELTAANNKRLVVITVTPAKETKYKLKNNEMYHRLSASNFRYTTEKQMFSRSEMEFYATKRIAAFQQAADQNAEHASKLSEDYSALLKQSKDFEAKCALLSHEVDEFRTQAKELREEVEATKNWLKNAILTSKQIKEKELEESTTGCMSRLLCFL
jgi:predicted HTH transcriptional regulator